MKGWLVGVGLLVVLPLVLIAVFLAVGTGAETAVATRRGQQLEETLREVTEQLEAHDIPYFIDYGTALGHIRDHGVIPGDIDIDIGLFEEMLDREQLMKALKVLWKKYHIYQTDRIVQLFGRQNTNNSCDLYVYQSAPEQPDLLVYNQTQSHKATIFPTRQEAFGKSQVMVQVPAQPHPFLVDRFGTDYHTPKRWDKGVEGGAPGPIKRTVLTSGITWRDLLHIQKPLPEDIPPLDFFVEEEGGHTDVSTN